MSANFQPNYHAAAPAAQQYQQYSQVQQYHRLQYPQSRVMAQPHQQPQAQYQQGAAPCPVVVPRLKNKAGGAGPYTHSPYSTPMPSASYQDLASHHVASHESSLNSQRGGSVHGGHLSSDDGSSNDGYEYRQYRQQSTISMSAGCDGASGFASELDCQGSQGNPQMSARDERQGGIIKITVENVVNSRDRIIAIAGRPHGSSFLQAALRQFPIEAFEVAYKEMAPVMGKLLVDKHACYVVKMLLEMMDKEEAMAHLDTIAVNEDLLLTLCTKDLHSRRMVQFILDFAGASRSRYLLNLVMTRPMDIVRTQQGCITLQRILDRFPGQDRDAYFATVRGNFMEYAMDPFGNYIIQYMLTDGNQVENSNTLALHCRGQLHKMICHKYASNVIEKCFGLVTPELQHEIIEEIFNAPEPTLMRVLSDRSANYVVQAAIRAASFRDVQLVKKRIGTLLPHMQFGKNLQERLARRLKQ